MNTVTWVGDQKPGLHFCHDQLIIPLAVKATVVSGGNHTGRLDDKNKCDGRTGLDVTGDSCWLGSSQTSLTVSYSHRMRICSRG